MVVCVVWFPNSYTYNHGQSVGKAATSYLFFLRALTLAQC